MTVPWYNDNAVGEEDTIVCTGNKII